MQHVATAQHAGAPMLIQPACTHLPLGWLTDPRGAGGVLPGWGGLLDEASNGTAVHLSLSDPADRISQYYRC